MHLITLILYALILTEAMPTFASHMLSLMITVSADQDDACFFLGFPYASLVLCPPKNGLGVQ